MLELLNQSRIIPVVVIDNHQHAVPLAQALIKGGINIIEVTLRTPAALAAIKEIANQVPDMVVGAGTVTHPNQFREAKAAGATFAVSPGLTPTLASAAHASGLPYLPGIATVSEGLHAIEQGFHFVKFFPAELLGGVKMLSQITQVLPQLKFCPTGGVSELNLIDYLELKCVACVGGTWLAPPAIIQQEGWPMITHLVEKALSKLS